MIKKLHLSLLFFLAFYLSTFATHNRAGEITYKWTGTSPNDYRYKIIVTTYTRINSPADRCSLVVNFGSTLSCNPFDSIEVFRVNGPIDLTRCNAPLTGGETISSDIRKNIYESAVDYVFPGPGQYRMWMYDPNRNSGIVNIPNSVNTPFFIESYLFINPFLGNNSSPTLNYPPIDNACLYKCFYHNPAASDVEGDSLSFELGLCLGTCGAPVQQFNPSAPWYYPNNVIVNPITGDLVWCTPQPAPNPPYTSYPQSYNFAIYIKEYRKYNGQWYLIGFVERDLQVDVEPCPNNPPDIINLSDTCIIAGDTLCFDVFADDIDNDLITLTALGAPFSTTPAATFTPYQVQPSPPIDSAQFCWNTNCNLIRNQPYIAVFKAQDNDLQNPLVDLETILIRVIAPAPIIDSLVPVCSSMRIYWRQTTCNPSSNICLGYRIYRLDSCDTWQPSYCETGVPGYTGYTLIGTVTGVGNTNFTDVNLSHGKNYAYRVVAFYADGAESKSSDKLCQSLVYDVPIITHADVLTTSTATGSIEVKWQKPLASTGNLDTIAHPGPYQYIIRKKIGYTGANQVLTTISAPTYSTLTINSYIDNNINTADTAHVYSIQLVANNGQDTLCLASEASSVYLNLAPSDNALTLTWNFNVPWSNYRFDIYRFNTQTTQWDSIGTTAVKIYKDSNLVNGRQYCYKIKAYGQYSDVTLPRPLINWSEEKCGVPQDLTAPCPPQLTINSNCNTESNNLTWTNPNLSCADDVVSYNVYYTSTQDGDYQLLITIQGATNNTFLDDTLDNSIAGCYYITAVDSFGNESQPSNIVCVDNCPEYELPNVFTPNGDGQNDYFIPLPYKYVKDIDLHIYNRWGEVVFETTNADILWDGKHKLSKQLCSDGVYYYVCVVNEIRLAGIKKRTLTGFVQIFSKK